MFVVKLFKLGIHPNQKNIMHLQNNNVILNGFIESIQTDYSKKLKHLINNQEDNYYPIAAP